MTALLAGPAPANPYVVKADFFGTTNGFPNAATIGGTANPNTASALLTSTYSLSAPNDSATATWSFPAMSSGWLFMFFRKDGQPTGNLVNYIALRAAGVVQMRLREGSTTTNRWYVGAANQNVTFANSTAVAIWVNFNTAAGTANVYVQTDGTQNRPASPIAVSGSAVSSVDSLVLAGAGDAAASFAKVRVSASEIGSNPP